MAIRSLALAVSLLIPAAALAAPKHSSLPPRSRATLPTAPAQSKAKPKNKPLTRMKPGSTIQLDRDPLKLAARPNPAALNLALTALRRFADDVRGRTPVDRAVARSLKGTPRARKIARRILARIDAQPPKARQTKLGVPSNEPVTAAALRRAAIGPLTNGVGIVRTDTLPAMSPTAPSSYRLALTGVRTVETADADADGDELLVTLVRASSAGLRFETEISDVPLDGLQAGVRTLDETVLEGHGLERLIASIALEVDGDEAAVREEVRVMIGLARAHEEHRLTPTDV